MNFLPIFEYEKYFAFALSITFIFADESAHHHASETSKNDTLAGKTVHPPTVQSDTTSFYHPENKSKISSAKPNPPGRIKSEAADDQSPSTATNCVVVFDVDDTICVPCEIYNDDCLQKMRANYTECPQIPYTHRITAKKYVYIFLPHLKILFDYLLEHGARIVFFSLALTDRYDEKHIPHLLKTFWGSDKYEALRAKGQFAMYGWDDARWVDVNKMKDLRIVLRGGETLSDVILVDKDVAIVGFKDQRPFIVVNDLRSFAGYGDTVLNSIYYMLGLFKTYFENEEYRKLPIKTAMSRILPTDHPPSCACEGNMKREPPFTDKFHCTEHPFVRDMVGIGLSAVQEIVPNATLYQHYLDLDAEERQYFEVDPFALGA